MFLGKGILKICSKFTGEYPCQSAISIKLLCNFIEITHRHGCSPINLLHIFRTPFPRDTSDGLLLDDDPLFKTFVKILHWHALREKCPYSELFCSVFSRILTRTTPNTDSFHAVMSFRIWGRPGWMYIKTFGINICFLRFISTN